MSLVFESMAFDGFVVVAAGGFFFVCLVGGLVGCWFGWVGVGLGWFGLVWFGLVWFGLVFWLLVFCLVGLVWVWVFWFLETGFFCVVLAVLELTL